MRWDLGFLLLIAAIATWIYLSLRAEMASVTNLIKRLIAAEEARGAEQIADAATANADSQDDLDSKIRKQVYRDCPRYGIQDSYTTAKLSRSYESRDSRRRIRLLRRLYRQGVRPPYDLALKAVTDSDPSVREWMAREAQDLDYRERRYVLPQPEEDSTLPGPSGENSAHNDTVKHLQPDRDLTERLKQDSDPFVRAALYENRHLSFEFGMSAAAFGDGGIAVFSNCTPLERLALMRNKELSLKLVKHILDLKHDLPGIDIEERTSLAKACLVNPKVVTNGRLSREIFPTSADGYGAYTIRKDSEEIWRLASSWPEDTGVPSVTFKYVQTEDNVKAEILRECQNANIRRIILESCMPDDEKTISLGRSDNDPMARFIAYGRSRHLGRREIADALRRETNGGENWVINGLLGNPWIGRAARELQMSDTPQQSAD